MRNHLLGALFGVVAVGSFGAEREARACGGDFLPPAENETVTTDHRMIFSISQQQTTLYDQIEYHGSPSSFAWVLPIKGTVTVGLSADILFDTLDSLTASQVVQPATDCPPPPVCDTAFPTEGAAADDAGAAHGGGGVTVTSQAQVGPYDTVQLHTTDKNALNSWLASNGFSVPSSAAPILAAYIAEGFDFLAMKLMPGKGVAAMRPVRVTSQGASGVLPLRMVSIGTGATTGITLWVVADGRLEPQNFPFFTISDSDLAWNWTTSSSNYETLRLSKEAALGGKGWQVESSLELAQGTITSGVSQNVELGGASIPGAYAPASGSGGQAAAAQQDLGVLLSGIGHGINARITRLRGDIAHSALAGGDLTLQASADQTVLSNLYNPAAQIGQPQCPVYNNSCSVISTVPRDQAIAAANGGGCNTTRATSASPAALAGLAGLLGLALARARRRRLGGR